MSTVIKKQKEVVFDFIFNLDHCKKKDIRHVLD